MKTYASSPNGEASKRSAIAIAFITIHYYNYSLSNRTTCMHRNRKLCISFFMANIANGTPPQRCLPTYVAILHYTRKNYSILTG